MIACLLDATAHDNDTTFCRYTGASVGVHAITAASSLGGDIEGGGCWSELVMLLYLFVDVLEF